MNKNYFSIDEDFNKIINTVLSDPYFNWVDQYCV